MSRYFVTDPPVAVPEFEPVDGGPVPNVIYIRSRMDVETRAKARVEALGDINASDLVLLIYNIVRWEGPDLGNTPCTPANIRKLIPDEPHITKVLGEIVTRNTPRISPNPKSAGASTSGSAGIAGLNPPGMPAVISDHSPSVSQQLATTTSRSNLRSAVDGHLSKSGD